MRNLLMNSIRCGVPTVMILLLPVFGVNISITIFVFVILMLGVHEFMMREYAVGTQKTVGEIFDTMASPKEENI